MASAHRSRLRPTPRPEMLENIRANKDRQSSIQLVQAMRRVMDVKTSIDDQVRQASAQNILSAKMFRDSTVWHTSENT